MNKIFKSLIHSYMPESLQILCRRVIQKKLINTFLEYSDSKYNREISVIKKEKWFLPIPYKWIKEYDITNYSKGNDSRGVYVLTGNKKLYIRSDKSKGIGPVVLLRDLMIEQDKRSPHQYFSDRLKVNAGDIFIDCGAAEGLITLMVIDKVKHAYLFESEKRWNGPLNCTFSDKKEKITIVNKYVSDIDDESNTTLNYYIKKYRPDQRIVIKMDIEGAEVRVIKNILSKCSELNNLFFSVCTYHNTDDAVILKEMFEKYGYTTEFSDGYMLYGNPKEFRKGIIRAWKK